ncbi:hypothetical protein [uncultured Roseivirga sp.]|uniref:hypothetical protein n=1 Tax=uncultured Roseivirga sp. TaxID=543088 RepID=UPI0030D99745
MLILNFGFSQNVIEWSPEYKVTLTDFKSPETEINSQLSGYTLFPGTNIDFSFHMSSYAFMFKKNFNDKVSTTFNRDLAAIIAPDSTIANQLVEFGQYSFDLTELYSRKFRKEIYENKGAFSDISFYQPILKKLQQEMDAENSRMLKSTEFGKDLGLIKVEHQKVLLEIESYADFCKECKPPKKKKK